MTHGHRSHPGHKGVRSHFELIRTLLGQRLTDRWEMWQPSINAIGGSAAYPMFERLATKMRAQV